MLFYLKFALILFLKCLIFSFLGASFFGWWGLAVAATFSVLLDLYFYFFCVEIISAGVRAKPIDYYRYSIKGSQNLQKIVGTLAYKMHLPLPEVLLFKEQKPLLYIWGRSSYEAKLVISTGLLHILSPNELDAILTLALRRMVGGGLFFNTYLAALLYRMNQILFGTKGFRMGFRNLLALGLFPYWLLLARLAQNVEMSNARFDQETASIDGGGATLLAEALSRVDLVLSYERKDCKNFAFCHATGHLAIVSPMVRNPWMPWFINHGLHSQASQNPWGGGLSARTSQLLKANSSCQNS